MKGHIHTVNENKKGLQWCKALVTLTNGNSIKTKKATQVWNKVLWTEESKMNSSHPRMMGREKSGEEEK